MVPKMTKLVFDDNDKALKFKVVFTGKLIDGYHDAKVLDDLSILTQRPREQLKQLLCKPSQIFATGLSAKRANDLQAILHGIGIECYVKPETIEEQNTALAVCPHCNYQARHVQDLLIIEDTCPACGIVVHKYLKHHPSKVAEKNGENTLPQQYRGVAASGISGYLPTGMFKGMRIGLIILGIILLLSSGISIFRMPAQELSYALKMDFLCATDGEMELKMENPEHRKRVNQALIERCIIDRTGRLEENRCGACSVAYRLDLMNTGIKTQPQTVVRLRLADIGELMHPPLFLDNDRKPRSVMVRERDGITSYALGELKPAKRVTLRINLIVDKREQIPAWDVILKRIDVARGDVFEGNPMVAHISRMILSVLSWGSSDVLKVATNVFLDDMLGKDNPAIAFEFNHNNAQLGVSLQISEPELTKDCATHDPYRPCRVLYQIEAMGSNAGPGDAKDVNLTFRLPDDAIILQSYFKQEDLAQYSAEVTRDMRDALVGQHPRQSTPPVIMDPCRLEQQNVICTIERLSAAGTVYLRQNLSLLPGSIAVHVLSIDSQTPDYDLSDNTVIQTLIMPSL